MPTDSQFSIFFNVCRNAKKRFSQIQKAGYRDLIAEKKMASQPPNNSDTSFYNNGKQEDGKSTKEQQKELQQVGQKLRTPHPKKNCQLF